MTAVGATLRAIAASSDGPVEIVGDDAVVASDVTHDSRDVRPGSLFVAISGARYDGYDFVDTAVANGAVALAVGRTIPTSTPYLVVDDPRRRMAAMARTVHGAPDEHLSIVGVTGTNGKTTVTRMCEAAWLASGRACAVVGTLGIRSRGVSIPSARTTPESSDLQRMLGAMVSDGVDAVALEVSSHALELHRADAVRFTAVGFTNLSQDHLDFHGDMESYYLAKRSLFDTARSDVAVLNVDDPVGRRLAGETSLDVVRVGLGADTDVSATSVDLTSSGTEFVLRTPEGSTRTVLPLLGRFNVHNALVAAGLLRADRVDVAAIGAGFERLEPVAGRMEVVASSAPFTVVVDYAHTPDAIAAVLRAASEVVDERVIAVVGAGGDRDRDKRALMGAAASRGSDVTIITTDNPRSEDPTAIAAEVKIGADSNTRATVRTVLDRRTAITAAIEEAAPGDIVLILGKGHEQGQEFGDRTEPFDDRTESSAALALLGYL